jgi:hypothetical protein
LLAGPEHGRTIPLAVFGKHSRDLPIAISRCASPPMNDKAPVGRAEDRPMPERVHEIGGADCVHERVKLHLAQFAH